MQRKLKTYCYGLFSGQANQNSLMFWDETVSNKGSNQVISAAHEFFTVRRTGSSHLCWWYYCYHYHHCYLPHHSHHHCCCFRYHNHYHRLLGRPLPLLFSYYDCYYHWHYYHHHAPLRGDNTSSQMKNQYLFLYCAESVRDDGFAFYNRIDNKYSPPGHTFMENDRAFGVLSRKAKKTKIIGSSKAWMRLASKAKQPSYHTVWMDQPKVYTTTTTDSCSHDYYDYCSHYTPL
jgi:hypothetical protein